MSEANGQLQPPEPLAPPDERLLALTEALLFAAGRVVTAEELAAAAEEPVERLEAALTQLEASLNTHGVALVRLAGGWRLVTRPEHVDAVKRLLRPPALRLSPARLETLAVIAWRQPTTRAEVEAIRGVDCSATLRSLLDLELAELRGRRLDKPGQPLQYGTGARFLIEFGLSSLNDLPRLEELDS